MSVKSSQTLTYNAGNQISTIGYSYDGGGNHTATPTATYRYNVAEQMTAAVIGGVMDTYTYAGASPIRVLSETKGGVTGFTTTFTFGRTDANG